MFGTGSTTNTLYAQTNDGAGPIEVLIPGSWIGSPHRYRIERVASEVRFYIDGTLLHTETITISASLRPLFSDYQSGGSTLAVDWLRITPFTSPCTLESRVFDAGQQVIWSGLSWTADVPTGTARAMSARSGNTIVPDGTWTAWTAVAVPGSMNAGIGRYAQYRAVLSATDTTRTPVLRDVTLSSSAPPSYTLTVTLPTNGTITGTGITCGTGGSDCTETYGYGTVVPLTATPATGYDFGGWTGACTGTGACSVTMTAARTVGATFLRYTLTVTPPTHGTITGTGITCGTGGVDCTEIYDLGTVVSLTATPDANYDFGGWTGACSGTGACSVTMTAARTVGATFTIQRFMLTVGAPTHGTITATGINCGTGGADCTEIYDYGTVVPLTATPDTGYNFGGWAGDCSGTGACSLTMTVARAVGAIFTIQRHTLTVTAPTNGTITGTGITCGTGGSTCSATYDYGTVVPLTATPDTGYSLSAWTGACTGTGACSVTMTAARTVGATFAIQRHTLTVTLPTNGTITATGITCGTGGSDCTETYDYGTVVLLAATPSTGYSFGGWTGACSGTGACSVTMTAARTVGATFTIQRFTLTVTAPTHGTITGTGIACGTGGSTCSATYDYGTVVPLTATPDANYSFGGWTGSCTGTGACSVTMTAARTVGATFTIQRFTLTVTAPSHGTITATGITCGTGGVDCTETYDWGSIVPLGVAPDTGYQLRTWAGACTGIGACSVTMTAARTVGGLFTPTFQQRKGDPSPYTGPELILNAPAARRDATPDVVTDPVRPLESGPASAPEPKLEPTPVTKSAPEPKLELAPEGRSVAAGPASRLRNRRGPQPRGLRLVPGNDRAPAHLRGWGPHVRCLRECAVEPVGERGIRQDDHGRPRAGGRDARRPPTPVLENRPPVERPFRPLAGGRPT